MRALLSTILTVLVPLTGVVAQSFEKLEFSETTSGDKLRYALLKPAKIEPGKTYPLVIALHGVGGRDAANWERNCAANAVLAAPEMRKKHPAFVVAPTCAKSETWRKAGKLLQGKERLADVFELIEQLLGDQPIDKSRIYVTGQSMGGYGTFAAIVQRPDLFAAAAPVCGGNDPANAAKIAQIPIWVFSRRQGRNRPGQVQPRHGRCDQESWRRAEIHRVRECRPQCLDTGLQRWGTLGMDVRAAPRVIVRARNLRFSRTSDAVISEPP